MRYLIIPVIALLFLAAIIYNPGKESWEQIGPKWHCAFNPNTSEYCRK